VVLGLISLDFEFTRNKAPQLKYNALASPASSLDSIP